MGCDTSLYLAPLARGRCALQIVCPDDLSNRYCLLSGGSNPFTGDNKKAGARPAFLLSGGEGGIRTPGPSRVNGFQDRRFRPLSHLSGFLNLHLTNCIPLFPNAAVTAALCRTSLYDTAVQLWQDMGYAYGNAF